MPRQLLVLRHAKSAWDTDAPSDFERPLAKRGRKEAPRIGIWLRHEGLVPEHVVSSPAVRARQTALKVCKELKFPGERIAWDARIYEAGIGGLLAVLADCPADAHRVMIVGHNPGLEMLVRFLSGGAVDEPADGKLLPTAALACLDMPEVWDHVDEGSARVLSVTRARGLEDLG